MTKACIDDPSQLRLLFAMLQHEVRTPLSAIVGFADLLRPDMPHDELLETVLRIKSSAGALGEIIDAIPVFSGLDSGRARLEERPFELVDLIDDLVRSFRTQAEDKRLELTADVDRRIPACLVGAPGPLRQVLANLLANAVKFTDDGRIQIELEQVGARHEGVRVRYSIADTGRGIPRELQAAIFEPFARGEVATSAETNGSGLGLSICVKLLRAMDSRIELESGRGRGSTFSFELFHPHPEREHRESVVRRTSSNGDRTPRVLIVEDDSDNRELLRRLVRREGFAVDLARHGRDALSTLERRDYAVLFSDLRMSGMDGFELARRIRECEAASGKQAPHLVAVTAGSSLMNAESRARQDLFDTILLKPLRQRVLSGVLAPFRAIDGGPVTSATGVPLEPVDTVVVSLVPDFLARRSDDLRVLRASLSGGASLQNVSSIGHNLRGSARSFGFPRLSELGASLEDAARQRDLDRIARLADEMERLLAAASGGAAVVPIRRT